MEEWARSLGLVTLGLVVGWGIEVLHKWKEIATLQAEREKLHAELTAVNAENKIRVQMARREYDEAQLAMTPHLIALRDALNSEPFEVANADSAREEACRHLHSPIVGRYLDYVEIHAEIAYRESEDRKRFIDEDVLEELRRFAKWLRVLNGPHVLGRLPEPRNPCAVSKRTLRPFRELAKGIEFEHRDIYFQRLDDSLDDILAAGTLPDDSAGP